MPSGNVLPDTLSDLSRCSAIVLNDDHWNPGCNMLAVILKNALNVSRSLKERKIRRYAQIVFALSVLVTALAILSQFFPPDVYYFGLIGPGIKLLSIVSVIINVALVTYLLGNLKKNWIVLIG